jgi:hypothetical protein
MTRLNAGGGRCEALLASGLQRSDALTAASVAEAISGAVRRFGTRGCAVRMAREFGDHPQTAAEWMRWARRDAAKTTAGPQARPPGRSRTCPPAMARLIKTSSGDERNV